MRRLHEVAQPLAAPDDDDAGHAAQEDIGAELDEADDGAAERARAARITSDGRRPRPAARPAAGRRRRWARSTAAPSDRRSTLSGGTGRDQQQRDQQQRAVAVPEVCGRKRQTQPAAGRRSAPRAGTSRRLGEVGLRVKQAEGVELLVREVVDALAARDEDLALAAPVD